MPSSPGNGRTPDPARQDAEQSNPETRLRLVCEGYEAALDSLRQGDLEAVADALSHSEELLATPSLSQPSAALNALHERATTAHHRLVSALSALHAQTGEDLDSTRRGRRVLQSYGSNCQQPGQRLRSRA